MREKEIGVVRRYFSDRFLAVIELTADGLQIGDQIHIFGQANDFVQEVTTLWCDGRRVAQATVGQRVEIEVADHARVHDAVACLQEPPPAARASRGRPVEALA